MLLNLVSGGKSLVFVRWPARMGNTRSSFATGATPPSQFAPSLQRMVLPPPVQVLVAARAGAGASTAVTSASRAPRTTAPRRVGGLGVVWRVGDTRAAPVATGRICP